MVRADAERNRRRLLDAALAAFGSGAGDPTLDAIARKAGVGIGTLYRHFPTREALIEAIYRDELARLCDEVDELLAEQSADCALRSWMGRYADFVATKRGMAEALRVVIGSGAVSSSQTRAELARAVERLLRAGCAARLLRADVPAADVVAALAGIVLGASADQQRDQVDRLLDLLVDGLRPR